MVSYALEYVDKTCGPDGPKWKVRAFLTFLHFYKKKEDMLEMLETPEFSGREVFGKLELLDM